MENHLLYMDAVLYTYAVWSACVRACLLSYHRIFSIVYSKYRMWMCTYILRRQTGAPILFAFHLILAHISCVTGRQQQRQRRIVFIQKIPWTPSSLIRTFHKFSPMAKTKTESVYKWLERGAGVIVVVVIVIAIVIGRRFFAREQRDHPNGIRCHPGRRKRMKSILSTIRITQSDIGVHLDRNLIHSCVAAIFSEIYKSLAREEKVQEINKTTKSTHKL